MNNNQIEVEEDEIGEGCSRCGEPLTDETTPISDSPEHDGLCAYCAHAWDNFD